MVHLRRLQCILLGALIGFLVSVYFINTMAVCCSTAAEAINGAYCIVCSSNKLENLTTVCSEPPVPLTDHNSLNASYLRIFDEAVFQYNEKICPWSICFEGPCVPINLQVKIFDVDS